MQYDHLSCPICYSELDQADHLPRIIPTCGHTVCSHCLGILLNQNAPKCPLDKKPFTVDQDRIESFPVNFMVSQLLDGKLEKDLCKEHQEETRFVCLTDKYKICDDCICSGNHKGHEIQSMKKVKSQADSKRKVLETLLEKLDMSRQEIDDTLEGKRVFLVKSIKDRFEELRWILNNKEQQLTFEVNSFFGIEREKINGLIGTGSSLRSEIVDRAGELADIFKQEEYLKTDDYFSKVEEKIQHLTSKVNFNVIKEYSQELKQGLEKMSMSFDNVAKSYTESCARIEIPYVNFSDSLLRGLSDENSNNVQWQMKSKLSPIKTKSVLNFEYDDQHLEILVESRNPKEVVLDVEKWKRVKEVKFDLKQYVLTDDDFRILVYLWKKLDNVVSFSLKFNPMGVSDNELISVFKTIIGGAMRFEKADIDLEHCQITDKSTVFLVEKVLSRLADLKSLNINLNSTPVTGKTVEAITKNIILTAKNLENFQLFLTSTCMTDESISRLFIGMPSVKHFSLSLSGTSITDRSIENLAKNTLPSLKSLENFEIYLHTTKVTDFSIEHLIPVLKKVRRLSLDFGCTDITDRSVELLSKILGTASDNIEEFALSVGGTKVTDQSITRMFTAMPRVKSFLLGLFDTEITDKSIEAFVKNTLVSMKALENFEMWLRDTEVTDASLEQMIMNMKDVKKFSLDLQGTKITDRGLERLLRENVFKAGILEEFKVNVANTRISERVKGQLEEFGKKLGK